ncbi:MAG: 50S ribosomal protein L6 [Fimbriimonadaceae bacterium]|nr:50S ribosomal protein L6 [Fimbriimonadaceae bacterium]
MSRIGRLPISIPAGVTVTISPENVVSVKGPKGELSQALYSELKIEQADSVITVERPTNDRIQRSQHGLARTLIFNMIEGVTKGHSKTLDIVGVGYRAQMEGRGLLLNMGYSHPVRIAPVDGVTFEVLRDEKARTEKITVTGTDKALVGQLAADIRKVRKPDPYKGKGIRYSGEVVRLKAGKRASAGKK